MAGFEARLSHAILFLYKLQRLSVLIGLYEEFLAASLSRVWASALLDAIGYPVGAGPIRAARIL